MPVKRHDDSPTSSEPREAAEPSPPFPPPARRTPAHQRQPRQAPARAPAPARQAGRQAGRAPSGAPRGRSSPRGPGPAAQPLPAPRQRPHCAPALTGGPPGPAPSPWLRSRGAGPPAAGPRCPQAPAAAGRKGRGRGGASRA